MVTFNGLPLFRATVAGLGDGVIRVSLVDVPAVESNFEVFRKAEEKAPALYAVQDEDRHLVRGVVLRANYPIFRRDNPQDHGYYVTFDKTTIRQIAEKYLAEDRQNNVDTDHNGVEVDGVRMVQCFLKDSAAGVDPEGFSDIEDGSLFAEYHVTNPDVWAEIKAGTWKGFSVEIFYTLIPAGGTLRRQDDAADVAGMLTRLFSKISNMHILKQIKTRLAAVLAEFGAVTTDKAVLYWDGDEDLKEGDAVYTEDEEGNRTPAADGDYVTTDDKTIVVVEGKVSEIKDPEAEVAPEEPAEEPAEEAEPEGLSARFARVRAAFEETYLDKEKAIVAAIYAARDEDNWYLTEAGDEHAVICVYGEEGDKFFRYDIAWNEDGTAEASNPVEVKPAYVPVESSEEPAQEEETATAEELASAVRAAETYKAENAALKARVAALEKRPAAPSAHDAFKVKGGSLPESTGDKGLDRLAARYRK